MGFRKVLWLFIYVAAIIYGINYWLLHKSYLIDVNDVIQLGNQYAGTDAQKAFKQMHKVLEKKYPGHILPASDLQWIFMNAGGWMGSICLVHASLTEYVLFFGTAVDTVGHSGRYWANITDTIIQGNFKQWEEGKMKANDFGPGDTIVHSWGEATAVQWGANTWMIEHGRGFIPSTLPFALSDTIFGTQDLVTIFYTFRVYTKALYQESKFLYVDIQKLISDYIY